MVFCPCYFTVVSGIGKSQFPLVSFDNALHNAGIGDYNVVKVSSILPANCTYSEKIDLKLGSIIFAAYSAVTVKEGEIGNTAVAVARQSIADAGVIFETSKLNSEDNLDSIVREMCAEAMKNRSKCINEIISKSKNIVGERDIFSSAISAVVMW